MADYIGAIVILEDYLDGAVHDYEEGRVQDDRIIRSCIEAIKALGGRCWREYQERLDKIPAEK